MPSTCMVVGCSARGDSGVDTETSFFRLPSKVSRGRKVCEISKERRSLWISFLRRTDLTSTKLKNARICSRHFHSGKPASLLDVDNPDWVPSLIMGREATKERVRKKIQGDKFNSNTSSNQEEPLEVHPKCIALSHIGDINELTSGIEVKDIAVLKDLNRKEIEVWLDSQDETAFPEESETLSQCPDSSEEFDQQCDLGTPDSNPRENHRSFPCTYCDKTFQQVTFLCRHVSHHVKRNLHRCAHCKKRFLTEGNLFVHTQRAHSKKCSFKCCVCPMSFACSSELKAHEISHSKNKTFSCDICSEKFIAEPLLAMHMKEHKKQRRRFQCGACDMVLCGREELDTHLREHSEGYLSPVYEENCEAMNMKNSKQFMCSVCFSLFSNVEKLKEHLVIHIRENPEKLSKVNSENLVQSRCLMINTEPQMKDLETISEEILQHSKDHNKTDSAEEVEFPDNASGEISHSDNEKPEILFQCGVCSKTFTQKNHLVAHLVFHSDERTFRCQICRKVFRKKADFRLHLRNFTNGSCLECPVCKKRFTTRNNLCGHRRRAHLTDRPFRCQVCSKTFSLICTLKAHEEIHTNEKSFSCRRCGKSFALERYLKRHVVLHERTPDQNLPKPHKCTLCEMRFRGRNTLKRHMVVHTGERNHHCPVCSRTFSRRQHLVRHFNRHVDRAEKAGEWTVQLNQSTEGFCG